MATRTFTSKNDRGRFGPGTKRVNGTINTGATLNSGDFLMTGGTDSLSIFGAGSFDLNSLAAFTGFEAVTLTGRGESLTLKNDQTLSVNADSSETVTLSTGNDTVTFASGMNFDNQPLGQDLCGSAHGGNNTPTGGINGADGGNETLVACAVSMGRINYMWDDAGSLSGLAVGGQDTFAFKDTHNGTVGASNFVQDFSQAQNDKIEFTNVAGVTSFADLVITQSGTDALVTAGADQVTLVNDDNTAHHLTASDFLFA